MHTRVRMCVVLCFAPRVFSRGMERATLCNNMGIGGAVSANGCAINRSNYNSIGLLSNGPTRSFLYTL